MLHAVSVAIADVSGAAGAVVAVCVVAVLLILLALLGSLVFCLFAVFWGCLPKGVHPLKMLKLPKLYKYPLLFLIRHSDLSICLVVMPVLFDFIGEMYSFDDAILYN